MGKPGRASLAECDLFISLTKILLPLLMDGQLLPPSLYTVKGIAVLDNDGNRILSNYYDSELFDTIKEEKAFEKNLFSKTSKASGRSSCWTASLAFIGQTWICTFTSWARPTR